MKNQSKTLTLTGASVLTIGTLVGGTIAPGQASAHAQKIHYTAQHASWGEVSDMNVHGLRLMFDAPLREHAAVGVQALRAELLQSPDLEALQDAVEDNNIAVAEAVETGYPGTHDEFLELWRAHIGYYKDYLHASVEDDEAGKEEAKENLAGFAGETSSLLADASPELDPDELEESLTIHADQVTSIIDHMVLEEYDDVYATAHEAYEHMGMTAELLARNANRQHTTHH